MKNSLLLILLTLCSFQTVAQESPSDQLLDAAVTKHVPHEKYVWNWRDAVLLKSLTDIYRANPQEREMVADYVEGAIKRVCPKAHGVHPNGVASAVGLAFLKEIGRSDEQTDLALERVLGQYRDIVRAVNGACSHRAGAVELWDDTVYMIGIAMVGCYRATGDISYIEEFADQILAHYRYLGDPKTGLWYHGWAETSFPAEDACSQYGWNTNPNHRNDEFWGRGNGWIAMSLVDLLEILPETDCRYQQIKSMFGQMMTTLLKVQDRKTGMWRQLPLHVKDKGNFLESSCTAMFGYAAVKGAKIGVLDEKFLSIGRKAYDGLVEHCLIGVGTDDVRLGRICAGTCVGDREYYYKRSQVDEGESYAIGAMLMLANELSQ